MVMCKRLPYLVLKALLNLDCRCTEWHSTLCSEDKQRSYHAQWTDCDYSRTANKTGFGIITASNPAYNYDPNIVRVARSTVHCVRNTLFRVKCSRHLYYSVSSTVSHWWPAPERPIWKSFKFKEWNRIVRADKKRRGDSMRARLRCAEAHGILPPQGYQGSTRQSLEESHPMVS